MFTTDDIDMIPTWCVGMRFKDKVSTRRALHSDAGASLPSFANCGRVFFQGVSCKIKGDNVENQCLSHLHFTFSWRAEEDSWVSSNTPSTLHMNVLSLMSGCALARAVWVYLPPIIRDSDHRPLTYRLWKGHASYWMPRALCKLDNHNSFKYSSVRVITN